MTYSEKGFRFYYDKCFDYLLKEELRNHYHYRALRYAKARIRMYANLYNRDMRKIILNADSICGYCSTTGDLQLDHKIPISKGGRNELNNLQILCAKCNLSKRAKL